MGFMKTFLGIYREDELGGLSALGQSHFCSGRMAQNDKA